MSENKQKHKEPKGRVYLLVVDDTPEFDAALERVLFLAQENAGKIALLHVIEEDAFLHWKFIESKIEKDKRKDTEKKLWEVADRVFELSGTYSGFYIKEGKTHQEVAQLISSDESIRALVLGAAKHTNNPLISYFTGKGLSELSVPLVIVPSMES